MNRVYVYYVAMTAEKKKQWHRKTERAIHSKQQEHLSQQRYACLCSGIGRDLWSACLRLPLSIASAFINAAVIPIVALYI